MATSLVPGSAAPQVVRQPGRYDRAFYSGMAALMALTVFVGFARTYYLRAFFDVPTLGGRVELTPLVYVHGFVFTAWVALFVVQTGLVRARRVDVHRRVGVAGMVLAAIMVPIGVSTAIAAGAAGAAAPGIDPLAFMAVPLTDMVLFTLFVSAALLNRRDREAHKRLMLLAYVSIITAAVARIPGLVGGPLVFFSLSFVFVLFGMVYDGWSRRRVHPVYLWGGALIALSVPGRLALSGTAAWHAFAEFLTR
ncbi:MAG TPA: hypothetical protein VF198_02995 [Vicinamibacterales bacterium]